MDEVDGILIQQLKSLGVTVKTLDQLDSPTFLGALVKCFEHISKMLRKEDNFIDVAYMKKQKLSSQTDKFRLCQKIS